jgi:PAS domain S-box-containing protein
MPESLASLYSLRENDQLFRAVFENAAIGIAIAEAAPDGAFLQTNDRFCEMLGYGPGELVGRTFTDVTHPEDRLANAENVRAILAGEIASYRMEKRYLRRDGSPLWVNVTMALMRDRENKPTVFIGSLLDISDLKRKEELLRQNDNRLRVTLKGAQAGAWQWNIATGLSVWSPEMFVLEQRDPQIGPPLYEDWLTTLHPDDQEPTDRAIRTAMAQGVSELRLEFRLMLPSGDIRWIEALTSFEFAADGNPLRMYGINLDITERKRAEESLRQNEEHLRVTLKGAKAGAWQWDLVTDEVIWLPETYVLYERDPRLGPPHLDDWWTLLHPEDLEPVERTIREALEKRSSEYRAQFRVLLPSGGFRWIEALASLQFSPDGNPLRMQGINLDITERKHAEKALKEREIRLSFGPDGGGVGTWDWDVVTNIMRWSELQCALFGIDPAKCDAVSYDDWLAKVHPDDRASQQAKLQDFLSVGGQDPDPESDYRIVGPDGVRWINARGRVQRDAHGKGVRMYGVTLDITERKRAEQLLAESEARFRAAQESSLDGFVIYQPVKDEGGRIFDFKVVYANPILAKNCLTTPEQMVGRLIGDILPHAKAPGGFIERARSIIESGKPGKFVLDWDGDGIEGYYRNLIVPFGGYAATTVRDITQSVRDTKALSAAKAEAERANLAKSKFLAAASHDLRQPTQAMTLMMGVIKREVSDKPKVAAIVDTVLTSIKSLNTMLSGILDISRLDAGVIQPEIVRVDLDEIVSRLAHEYRPRATKQGLFLRCRLRGLYARTDAALLERILRNLIENALSYTAVGGVLIGFRQRGDKIRLDVIDTGIGIPDDKLTEIFEEFRQLNNPARASSRGFGLGLSIVARLAGLLGIEVQVRSRLGRGTRFSLLLPLDQTAEVAIEPTAPRANPGGRILVIEDDEAVRESYEMLLAYLGYEVVSAATGEKALMIGEREDWRFDAILADHRLGDGLTGTATAAEICIRAGRAIPTMIVTGDTAKERLTEVSASGFVVLHKPVEEEVLVETLATLVASVQKS